MKLYVFCYLFIISASCSGQDIVGNPTTTQTITQPAGTWFNVNRFEKILFADRFSSIQSLITNSCPSSGCTIYIPPGSYTGPTSNPL
jgi:hypothetical protein